MRDNGVASVDVGNDNLVPIEDFENFGFPFLLQLHLAAQENHFLAYSLHGGPEILR